MCLKAWRYQANTTISNYADSRIKIVISWVFLLHVTRLRALFYIPTKYYQNISKGIKVIEHTRMHLRTNRQTDGCHADRYIPPPESIDRGIKSDLSWLNVYRLSHVYISCSFLEEKNIRINFMMKSFILPWMQKYKTRIWNRNLNKTVRFLPYLSIGMHALHLTWMRI